MPNTTEDIINDELSDAMHAVAHTINGMLAEKDREIADLRRKVSGAMGMLRQVHELRITERRLAGLGPDHHEILVNAILGSAQPSPVEAEGVVQS